MGRLALFVSLAPGVELDDDLTARISAVDLVKAGSEALGGKGGGGRPDMAQAGGKLPDKVPDALKAARKQLESLLSEPNQQQLVGALGSVLKDAGLSVHEGDAEGAARRLASRPCGAGCRRRSAPARRALPP